MISAGPWSLLQKTTVHSLLPGVATQPQTHLSFQTFYIRSPVSPCVHIIPHMPVCLVCSHVNWIASASIWYILYLLLYVKDVYPSCHRLSSSKYAGGRLGEVALQKYKLFSFLLLPDSSGHQTVSDITYGYLNLVYVMFSNILLLLFFPPFLHTFLSEVVKLNLTEIIPICVY